MNADKDALKNGPTRLAQKYHNHMKNEEIPGKLEYLKTYGPRYFQNFWNAHSPVLILMLHSCEFKYIYNNMEKVLRIFFPCACNSCFV